MRKLIFTVFLLYFTVVSFGQNTDETKNKITLSTYVDGYFSAYSNDLSQQEFQPFITVGARDNSFGVNVAQLGVKYEHEKVRGNVVLHYGDIPEATWSADFRTIQEANVGLLITEGLWLDAGFFSTHIGTESFLPKNNMLSSTAFKTFNEPFYQAGAKITYDKPQDWEFQFWLLNGYNNFVDNNDAKSVGALINYNLNETTSITYTNLYGRESEDDIRPKQNRLYQNIYINTHFDKIFLTVGFDYGLQTNSDLSNTEDTATMYAGLVTARYQFNPKYSITTRAEIFRDDNGFISGITVNNDGKVDGVDLTGFTLGSEYRPIDKAYIRAEMRYTTAADDLEIFMDGDQTSNNRLEVLFTMGLELDKIFGF